MCIDPYGVGTGSMTVDGGLRVGAAWLDEGGQFVRRSVTCASSRPGREEFPTCPELVDKSAQRIYRDGEAHTVADDDGAVRTLPPTRKA